ncbi:hypothetical protein AB4851_28190 [Burkholderia sp. 22PA0099]|uniref:hypothetical protein n=1 Tax=Burkholderia sp. 22PA0099 TaxID=3237372 RepID=UPI0039C33062
MGSFAERLAPSASARAGRLDIGARDGESGRAIRVFLAYAGPSRAVTRHAPRVDTADSATYAARLQ